MRCLRNLTFRLFYLHFPDNRSSSSSLVSGDAHLAFLPRLCLYIFQVETSRTPLSLPCSRREHIENTLMFRLPPAADVLSFAAQDCGTISVCHGWRLASPRGSEWPKLNSGGLRAAAATATQQKWEGRTPKPRFIISKIISCCIFKCCVLKPWCIPGWVTQSTVALAAW